MPESPSPPNPSPSASEAARALAQAAEARHAFAAGIASPPGYDPLYSVAAGMVVAGIGLSNATGNSTWRWAAGLALILVAVVIFGSLVNRFRVLNGVWISGFRPQRDRWVAAASGVAYVGLGVLAAWGASESRWWLFAVAVVAAVAAAYALSRLWMRVYMAELVAERA